MLDSKKNSINTYGLPFLVLCLPVSVFIQNYSLRSRAREDMRLQSLTIDTAVDKSCELRSRGRRCYKSRQHRPGSPPQTHQIALLFLGSRGLKRSRLNDYECKDLVMMNEMVFIYRGGFSNKKSSLPRPRNGRTVLGILTPKSKGSILGPARTNIPSFKFIKLLYQDLSRRRAVVQTDGLTSDLLTPKSMGSFLGPGRTDIPSVKSLGVLYQDLSRRPAIGQTDGLTFDLLTPKSIGSFLRPGETNIHSFKFLGPSYQDLSRRLVLGQPDGLLFDVSTPKSI
ncbi:hypothetical protein J6590_028078 [Homalodisca vitripennis]|nr:hypothetical protein J6590_028078 [Homalodisca vitripennis]